MFWINATQLLFRLPRELTKYFSWVKAEVFDYYWKRKNISMLNIQEIIETNSFLNFENQCVIINFGQQIFVQNSLFNRSSTLNTTNVSAVPVFLVLLTERIKSV